MPGVLILENGLIRARIGVLIRPQRKEHQVNVGVNKLRPILSQRSCLGRTAELPNIPWRRLGWAHAQFSIGTVYDRCRWDLMSDHPNQTRTPYEPSQRRKTQAMPTHGFVFVSLRDLFCNTEDAIKFHAEATAQNHSFNWTSETPTPTYPNL